MAADTAPTSKPISTRRRLRKERDHFRELATRYRREREQARQEADRYRRKYNLEFETACEAIRVSRNVKRAGIAAAVLVAFIVGLSSRGKPSTAEVPTAGASILRPMAGLPEIDQHESPDDIPGPLPQLDCETCPKASTDPHILASVRMRNGGAQCSATVLGHPRYFRKYPKVALVTAAHCVAGTIGAECTFSNPDGETSFPATLVAYDRTMDAAIFEADSSKPLAAVLMADPEGYDQRARFSSCNYPAHSGGPNYKLVRFAGVAYRQGADLGNLFRIDDTSARNGGYFNSGGSGGGLFVQPAGSAEWFFCSATTHGGDGRSIATPKCRKLFDWLRRKIPGDCGPWGCRPPQTTPPPNSPPKSPPENPEDKPDWFKPNVPILPNPPNDPPPVPKPIEDKETEKQIESRFERIESLIAILEKNQTAIPTEGPRGPEGPQGPPGADGKPAPPIDIEAIKAEANAAARAEVQNIIQAGGIKGEPGPAWNPETATEAELEAIARRLPPVRMVIVKDGKEYPNEQPLGKPLRLRFTGGQKVVTK